MSNGLFNLEGYENLNENDILNMSINESSEFAHKNPDTNHPEVSFETNGASGKNTSVPPMGTHKLNDDASVSIPGGDSETPKAKPYDATSINNGGKVTLTTDQYDAALAALKKSFKEGYEIMEMLENVDVVQQTIEQRQEEYVESMIGDQLLTAYEDGPVFEAVDRRDKNDVKDIVRLLRPKIEDELEDAKIKFYKPNLIVRSLVGLIPGYGSLSAAAAIKQIWSTRLWQVIGVCIVEGGNIEELTSSLTNKFKEELGDYKILYAASSPTILEIFRMKFGWKNTKGVFFLLVDKKLPKELKEMENMVKDSMKELKQDKKDDGKKKED